MPTDEEAYSKAHQQDHDGYLTGKAQSFALLQDRSAIKRVTPLLSKLKLSRSMRAQILSVLRNDLSYVHSLRAEVWKAGVCTALEVTKRMRRELRRSLLKRLDQPPTPPTRLRERMTRESVNSLSKLHDNLSQKIDSLERELRKAKLNRSAVRKRGQVIKATGTRLIQILKDAGWSDRKTARCFHAIMTAWNPAIAPESAESVRISSIRSRKRK